MADKKPGFFKRLFKFGKKKEPEEEIAEPTGPSQEELDRQAEAERAAVEAEQRAKEEAEAAAAREEEARRIAAETAEAERLAEEAANAEQERLEAERQAAEKLAQEKAEAERLKAEEEARVAAEKTAAEEREKKAAEEQAAKEAAERKAAEEAEAARLEKEKQEREARERAEQRAIQEAADAEEAARLKAEAEKAKQAEEERLAKEQAEREQQAAEKKRQEEERQKAEAEQREAEEKARREEEERLAQERAEQEAAEAEAKRLAEEQAEQDKAEAEAKRIAAEKEAAEAKRLAEEQAAKDAAEAERLAQEQAAAEVSKPDGVFEAPGETSTTFDGDTPEPLSDTPEPPVAAVPVEEEPKKKTSWFNRLKGGLSRSSTSLTESITGVFTKKKLDDDTLQDLEDILIRADLGVETAMSITEKLAAQRMGKDVSSEEVRGIMADEIEAVLEPVAAELELDLDHQPHVILVVGVNGSGKTTTIGKLSQKLYDAGFSTLLVAGDTFRAAAIEQLKIWGDRTQSPVLSRPLGSDAAGLAFDAYEQAKAEGRDVMLMDTAGRLQNRTELMDELAKIVRVLKKQDPEAPHTVLLTLDATTGQNALNQVEIFRDIAGVNGIVMTKLDGTARGGILVAISAKHKLPVFFLGVGEQVDDLEPFEAKDFARSIAGLA